MANIAEMLSQIYKITLSQNSQELLNSLLVRKEYTENQLLIDSYKTCTDFYIIEKGIIRQFYYKEGRDISEHFSAEGDITFCVESIFLNSPSHLCMETIEPCVLHLLDYKKLKMLCNDNVEISNLYIRILELDLVLTQRKADSWRFETAKQRYDRFCEEYPSINKRVPIAHIASYLLMSPETLSRVRVGKYCK